MTLLCVLLRANPVGQAPRPTNQPTLDDHHDHHHHQVQQLLRIARSTHNARTSSGALGRCKGRTQSKAHACGADAGARCGIHRPPDELLRNVAADAPPDCTCPSCTGQRNTAEGASKFLRSQTRGRGERVRENAARGPCEPASKPATHLKIVSRSQAAADRRKNNGEPVPPSTKKKREREKTKTRPDQTSERSQALQNAP